jgi:hypothetical protein
VSHKREEEEGKDDQMPTIEALPLLLLIVNSKAYLFSRVTVSRIRPLITNLEVAESKRSDTIKLQNLLLSTCEDRITLIPRSIIESGGISNREKIKRTCGKHLWDCGRSCETLDCCEGEILFRTR